MPNRAFDPADVRIGVKHRVLPDDGFGGQFDGDEITHAVTKFTVDTRPCLRAYKAGRIDGGALRDYYSTAASTLTPILTAIEPWVNRSAYRHLCRRHVFEMRAQVLDVELGFEQPVFMGCMVERTPALLVPRSVAGILTWPDVDWHVDDEDIEVAFAVTYPVLDREAWRERLTGIFEFVERERRAS